MLYRVKKYFKENDDSFAVLSEFFLVFAPWFFTMDSNWKYLGISFSVLSFYFVFAKQSKHLLFSMLLGWIYLLIYICFSKSAVSILIISAPSIAYWFISKHGFRERLDKARKKDK